MTDLEILEREKWREELRRETEEFCQHFDEFEKDWNALIAMQATPSIADTRAVEKTLLVAAG